MNVGFNLIAENAGLSIETLVLVIVLMGSIVFFARDFKVGIIFVFFASGACFMWFFSLYQAGESVNYVPSLVVFLLSFVVMSLTLYAVGKTGPELGGGFV